MNFAREGLVYIATAAGLSALGFVAAVMRRSWSLWLVAILLLKVGARSLVGAVEPDLLTALVIADLFIMLGAP